jgi:glycosyltransferase involved in cell wall biosynthesis
VTRIVHVASGREWRGGQRQTWLLARELQRQGVDQLLVTQRGSELARRSLADGVPVREVSWTMGLDPRAWWAVRGEARRGRAILHAHDGHAVTIARLASSLQAPWIATRRNSSPLGSPEGWQSAASIVAISNAVREQLRKDGIAEARIVVVPSGIDAEATRATPREDLRVWAEIADRMPTIVTVAAVTAEKGLLHAIAAAGQLIRDGRNVRWVIIGDGPLRAGFQSTVANPSWRGRVLFPGHHPDPVRLLGGADLFVLPSLSEGLGTSVLDAMALDVPVVTSDAGGLPELVGTDAGLVVPAGDSEALAAAVRRMLDDPDLRRRSVEGGRRVVERYSARAMASGMRSVYDSLDATR